MGDLNQALQRARATRLKQIGLQKKMAVLQKAESEIASEIKIIERQRNYTDEIKEAKRLVQEAKDAFKATRQREKELELELKETKKKARVEARVEEFECNQQQKQIEHVFVKVKELDHKKLEGQEQALAKKEGKLV